MNNLSNITRPKTLKESALASLREAISLGDFKPGERLVERVLCDRLGVSRTVIRECIRHLESEQLVISVPNSGPSVVSLGEHEVKEIYEIRMTLESLAVRSCAESAGADVVSQLRKHCDTISLVLKQKDVKAALQETRAFYQLIFHVGEKTVAWDLVERLNGRVGRLRAMTLCSPGRATAGPQNLINIVDAIEAGNGIKASLACEAHLRQACEIALQCLKDSE